MKAVVRAAAAALAFGAAGSSAEEVNPIGKVLQLLSNLEQKILREGEASQKVYGEFAEWCEDKSRQLGFEIKTGKEQAQDLEAVVNQQIAKDVALNEKLDKLSGEESANEKELAKAVAIRKEENKDFVAAEKELLQTVNTIKRAIKIVEKEMKGGASMLQMHSASSMAEALGVLVQASKISVADADDLTSLIQQRASAASADEDGDPGAPAAAAYENKSGNILQTLTDLLDDAEAQLDALRKKETENKNAFQLAEQALKNELKHAAKQITEAKTGIAAAAEIKSKAEGELVVVKKDIKADQMSLGDLHHECMTRAEDFESETKSRGEELSALAKAKEAIVENTGGAEKQTYGSDEEEASFLQVSARAGMKVGMKAGSMQYSAVHAIRALARKHHSNALAQLAAKMASLATVGAGAGDDQFAKVKAMIGDMIEKLEKEAGADAAKKAWCDKEIAETGEKKEDKTTEFEKLSTQIDKMTARSNTLKEEIAELQKSLAALTSSQANMDKIRLKEKTEYNANLKEIEQGLKGIKMALKVLREYYAKGDKAHDADEGAGSGIIGLLEVVESDFTKGLSEMTSDEESAQRDYDQQTKDNQIEKTVKEKDVEYKVKETAELEKTLAETQGDRTGVKEELDAVLEYWSKIQKECSEKAETFEERNARFQAEIAGLREALQTLGGGESLLQRGTTKRRLRAVAPHAQ